MEFGILQNRWENNTSSTTDSHATRLPYTMYSDKILTMTVTQYGLWNRGASDSIARRTTRRVQPIVTPQDCPTP
ncbi:hypothetical protein J6590_024640, partial [Homalodisca vitripennis]